MRGIAALEQHATEFGTVDEEVVGPFDLGGDVEGFECVGNAKGNGHGQGGQLGAVGFCGVQKGEGEVLAGFGKPASVVSATASGLRTCGNDQTGWNGCV